MPIYVIRNPETGQQIRLRGEQPPTAEDLTNLFATLDEQKTAPEPSPAPEAEPRKPSALVETAKEIGKGMIPSRWPGIVAENVRNAQEAVSRGMDALLGRENIPLPTVQETARIWGESMGPVLGQFIPIESPDQRKAVGEQIVESAAGLVLGSPEWLPTVAAGGPFGKAGQVVVGSAFSRDLLAGAGEEFAAAQAAKQQGDDVEAARHAAGATINAALGLAIPSHPVVREIAQRRTTLPRTTAAVEKLAPVEEVKPVPKAEAPEQPAAQVGPGLSPMPEPVFAPPATPARGEGGGPPPTRVESGAPVEAATPVVTGPPAEGSAGPAIRSTTTEVAPSQVPEAWIKQQQVKASKTGLGKTSQDAALKVVSEWIRKGETPDGPIPVETLEALQRSLGPTRDMETGETLSIGDPDWPRTGTLIDFLEKQDQARIETEPKPAVLAAEPTEVTSAPQIRQEQEGRLGEHQGVSPRGPIRPDVAEVRQEAGGRPSGGGGPVERPEAPQEAGVLLTKEAVGAQGEVRGEVAKPEAGLVPVARPSPQALGIVPPGTTTAMRVIDWFRKITPRGTPTPIRVEQRDVPRLSPQSELRATVTRPFGIGRVPVIGRLFDPRYRGGDEVQGVFITNAYSREVGNGIGSIIAAKFQWADQLFRGMPIADIAEAFYRDPAQATAQYRLNAEQQRALREAKPILDDTLAMMAEEGIPKAVALQELFEEQPNAYFPRSPVGKEGVDTSGPGTGGPGISPTPQSLRQRIFKSETEGTVAGIIYEPSFSTRLGGHVARAYSAVANYRMLNDLKSHGQTVKMRFEALAEGVFPDLALLKAAVGNATLPAQAKALMAKYYEAFDEARALDPDIFSDLREQAEHVTWGKEGTVRSPFFQGWIFPKELADKINDRIAPTRHRFVEVLKSGSLISKSVLLALDNAAPLVQGLPLLFWSLAKGKNIWGRAVAANLRAWLHPEYLSHELAKPGMRDLAREWVQLGGSLRRLDYLSGAEKGGVAERIPVLGRAFYRAGAAFGSFLDMGKLYFWRAVRDTIPEAERGRTVELIENVLGSARTRSIGMHPGTVDAMTIMELASAYYRSAPNLVAAMFEKGYTGKLARESLGYFTGGVILTTAGLMYATGLTPQQILDKFKRGDLTFPAPWFGGKKINVGFTHILISLAKLAARGLAFTKDEDSITGGGVAKNPWLRWIWAHSGPVPSYLTEVVSGRDFLGQKSDAAHALVKRVMPLAVGQFGTGLGREGKVTSVGDALPSIIGLNAWPQTYIQMRAEKAQAESKRRYGLDYEKLNVTEQAEIDSAISGDKALKKKPESSPAQVQAAIEAETARRELVRSFLSPEVAKKLDSSAIQVRGFDARLRLGNGYAYLNQDQQNAFAKILAERLSVMLVKSTPEKLSAEARQKWFDGIMKDARLQARAEFINQDRQTKGKHQRSRPMP